MSQIKQEKEMAKYGWRPGNSHVQCSECLDYSWMSRNSTRCFGCAQQAVKEGVPE